MVNPFTPNKEDAVPTRPLDSPATDAKSASPRPSYGAVNDDDESEKRLLDDSSHDTIPVIVACVDSPEDAPTGEERQVDDAMRKQLEDAPAMRYAIFTMIPMFMGYAALVTLQDNIKKRLHIGDNGSSASYEFSFACSLLYLGNLVFRLMHNVLFSFLCPRYRVCVAYCSMASSSLVLTLAYYVFDSQSLAWTYVAYIFGGIAIGTFESNLISCITPLGHGTKVWAQLGIPIGFSGISIGAFILFAVWPSAIWLQGAVYGLVCLVNMAGLAFFLRCIPVVDFGGTAQSVRHFWSDLKRFREWVPIMIPFALALACDMFCVSFFSAVQLYIYDVNPVPLWWKADAAMPINVFRAIYNVCSLLGDSSGRKLAYMRKRRIHPAFFLISSVIGGGLVLSRVTLLAPLGMFFIMFANGSVYATTTKYVDTDVNHRFNLISLSFWLFVGDVGSFIGANVVAPARVIVGPVPH